MNTINTSFPPKKIGKKIYPYASFLVMFLGYLFVREIFEFNFYEFFPKLTGYRAYSKYSYILATINKEIFLYGLLVSLLPWLIFLQNHQWSKFESSWLRWIMVLIVGLLAFQWGTVNYNHYYNQFFPAERTWLLLSPLLVYLHPIFIVLFLQVLLTFLAQYRLPFAFDPIDFRMLVEFLYLFLSFLLTREIFRNTDDEMYLGGVLTFLGVIFFTSGVSKIQDINNFGWITHYDLYLDFSQWYYLGWLSFLPATVLDVFMKLMESSRMVVVGGTLLLEFFIIFVLWSPFVSLCLLGGIVVFHVVSFIPSGFIFWQSIVTVSTIFALIYLRGVDQRKLYKKSVFTVSLFIIITASFLPLSDTYRLRWLPSRHNIRFTIEAVTSNGTTYPVSYRSYRPYLRNFFPGNQRFLLLTDKPQLNITHTDPAIVSAINNTLQNKKDLAQLKRQYGRIYDQDGMKNRLVVLLRGFTRNALKREANISPFASIIEKIPRPHYINSYWNPEAIPLKKIPKTVEQLNIRMEEAVFRDRKNHPLTDRIIQRIPLNDSVNGTGRKNE